MFYFYLDNKLLAKLGDFKIKDNSIIFEKTPEKRAERKFNSLLAEGFKNLKNKISGNKTVYVHKNSGIPLIGSNSFGIVDRNTSIIDIRPITSCNLNCIFCSVDSGISSKNQADFVVEREYLVEEFKKLVDFKGCDVEVHLGTQGEPLLYAEIVELIKDLSSIKKVKTISMDTNGTLLTEELVDKLAEAGITRINLSLNAMDKNLARKLAGCDYDVEKIKKIASYAAKKIELAIAPVLVPGFNDDEMNKLIEFAKKLKSNRKGYFIGIQNFLNYRFGRNPCKQLSWDEFYSRIKDLEKKTNTKLIIGPEDFNIQKTKKLPKPFKKGDIIKAEIVCSGRLKNEMLAVALNRTISIPNCFKKGNVKIRITR
ncbi:radical SAM protein, partial [Candidatus Woesearchaeota archaeon]|nr:radical SAM protein [Candidatus Woesearchaeota archaeon]